MSEFDTDTARRLRALAEQLSPQVPSEGVLSGAHRLARRRRRVLLASTVAAVVLLVGTVAALAGDRGMHRTTPRPAKTPLQSAPVPLQVFRLDGSRLLIAGRNGLEVRSSSGETRSLATPWSADLGFLVSAVAVDGAWYLLASDCQTAGLHVVRSDDEGRTWSKPVKVGFVSCSGSARLLEVGGKLSLQSMNYSATSFAISISDDGLHWPSRPQISDAGAGEFVALPDESNVRVICCGPTGQEQMFHATSLVAPGTHVALPARADVLGSAGAGDSLFVVLSVAGTPYSSSDGMTWSARANPFPRCTCSRQQLTVLSDSTWWAQAWDGHHSHYAVTTDGGGRWRDVPRPPGGDVMYPNQLVAWNDTSAVLQRNQGTWLTQDLGRHWQLLPK